MSESSINNAITTATEVVAAPLHWLDVLVTSLLSGAVALAVGLLAIIVISLFAWWRPISAAPFMRRSCSSLKTMGWPRWFCLAK